MNSRLKVISFQEIRLTTCSTTPPLKYQPSNSSRFVKGAVRQRNDRFLDFELKKKRGQECDRDLKNNKVKQRNFTGV